MCVCIYIYIHTYIYIYIQGGTQSFIEVVQTGSRAHVCTLIMDASQIPYICIIYVPYIDVVIDVPYICTLILDASQIPAFGVMAFRAGSQIILRQRRIIKK